MEYITKNQLMGIVKTIDSKNNNDFDSFFLSFKKFNQDLPIKKIEDIIDYFVFDLYLNSDADLFELSQYELDKITNGVNSVLND